MPMTRNRRSKISQPWLDDSILDMRWKRRALERKRRHTGLEIDKQIYTSQIDSVKLHIREAKCFYCNAALNNADTKATFQVLNSLTKPNEQKLPAHENDNIMCVAFAEFFDEKENRIIDFTRMRVTAESVVLSLLPPCPPVRIPFNDLCPTYKGELQKIIEARPSKCCSLDVLPTWLVKATLPATLPSLVRIVNASRLNGEFPHAFKIASVTPLLNKASLDQNFSPSHIGSCTLRVSTFATIVDHTFLSSVIWSSRPCRFMYLLILSVHLMRACLWFFFQVFPHQAQFLSCIPAFFALYVHTN